MVPLPTFIAFPRLLNQNANGCGKAVRLNIKAFRDAFGFVGAIITWGFGVAFLLVVCLLFRREQECAAAALAGRPELRPTTQERASPGEPLKPQ